MELIAGGNAMKKIVGLVLAGMILCWGVDMDSAKGAGGDVKNGSTSSSSIKVKRPAVSKLVKENSAAERSLDVNVPDVNDQRAAFIRERALRMEEFKKRREAQRQTGMVKDANEAAVRDRRLGRFREREGLQRRIEAQQGNPAAVLGKEQQQQVETIKEQMSREEIKHRWRLARLERIRELAGEESTAAEMVAKVDNLLGKELLRYEHRRMGFAGKLREIYMGKAREGSKTVQQNQVKQK
jgi:hypothetical protein